MYPTFLFFLSFLCYDVEPFLTQTSKSHSWRHHGKKVYSKKNQVEMDLSSLQSTHLFDAIATQQNEAINLIESLEKISNNRRVPVSELDGLWDTLWTSIPGLQRHSQLQILSFNMIPGNLTPGDKKKEIGSVKVECILQFVDSATGRYDNIVGFSSLGKNTSFAPKGLLVTNGTFEQSNKGDSNQLSVTFLGNFLKPVRNFDAEEIMETLLSHVREEDVNVLNSALGIESYHSQSANFCFSAYSNVTFCGQLSPEAPSLRVMRGAQGGVYLLQKMI